MITDIQQTNLPPDADAKEAADLLEGLEALREELGDIADELIELLRQAGITVPPGPSVH